MSHQCGAPWWAAMVLCGMRATVMGGRPTLLSRRLCATVAAGRHQTPVVDALWKKRAELKARDAQAVDSTPHERTMVTKSAAETANSLTYAFSTDATLADTYANPWGNVRVGRLLEDLDALAGTIAFEHCHTAGEDDQLIVTASVDRIVYRRRPSLDDDIVLEGRVTWVGRSSMEIGMRAAGTSSASEPFLEASFTFVARDPKTNRSASINPLEVAEGSEAARDFQLGQQRDDARKELRKRSKASVLGHALDDDAMRTAHALLARSKPLLSMPTLADPGEVLLQETRLSNAFIAQPQQRNTAGRIFGGLLMRRAFELAHATAYLFAGRRPVFLELDEVSFRSPVSVGDLLCFDSVVLYTSEQMDVNHRMTIHVEVLAQVIQPEQRSAVTSNTFNFTFGVAENADGSGPAALAQLYRGPASAAAAPELRRVLPATHEEAYRIMERYTRDLAQRAEDVAAGAVRAEG